MAAIANSSGTAVSKYGRHVEEHAYQERIHGILTCTSHRQGQGLDLFICHPWKIFVCGRNLQTAGFYLVLCTHARAHTPVYQLPVMQGLLAAVGNHYQPIPIDKILPTHHVARHRYISTIESHFTKYHIQVSHPFVPVCFPLVSINSTCYIIHIPCSCSSLHQEDHSPTSTLSGRYHSNCHLTMRTSHSMQPRPAWMPAPCSTRTPTT